MRRRELLKAGLASGLVSLSVGGKASAVERAIKLVVVGDGAVGKTCYLVTYTSNTFPGDYVPTVFDNYSAAVNRNGEIVRIGFWDTAGAEDYDRLRPLTYPGTDIVIIAYSIGSPATLQNVAARWMPELQQHIPEAPVLLAGFKSDLRASPTPQRPAVSYAEGVAMARAIGAAAYRECSALNGEGLLDLTNTAITVALGFDPETGRGLQQRRPATPVQTTLRPRRPRRGD